jgi:uncharacterized membrane protein YgdD (TMEM256/DUF423 family)
MLAVWQSAVQYHAWHALGLIAIGLSPDAGWARAGGWLLVAGIALFSGSLYALVLGAPKAVGAVTPFGGLAFILGWIAFAIGVIYARTPA